MSFIPSFSTLGALLVLGFGFGFVVFWHELGHFLAAKWAGVKVEQFAVGFGQAMLAWRKGLGLRIGTSRKEFVQRVKKHLESQGRTFTDDDDEPTEREIAKGSAEIGISETEYRLNWIPLGGYVKMLGQDDLKPNSEDEDPRAFNRQTIPKRMVIVSAGVIMNVFLAAVGFMLLFLIGFKVQPARVGSLQPNSPAQLAGWQIGDEIYTFDGKRQYNDWTKINLNVALAGANETTPAQIRRIVDGKPVLLDLPVVPQRGGAVSKDFVALGIGNMQELRGPDVKAIDDLATYRAQLADRTLTLPELSTVMPGDVITQVAGKDVTPADYSVLDAALQASRGKPLAITLKRADGKVETVSIQPRFVDPFGELPLNFAGLSPRLRIDGVAATSNAKGKLLPGDVVLSIATGPNNLTIPHPIRKQLVDRLNENGVTKVSVKVLRDGKEVDVPDIETAQIARSLRGLGVGLGPETERAIVGSALADTPAAGLVPGGATILKVGDKAVADWHETYAAMKALLPPMEGVKAPAAAAAIPLTFGDEMGEHTVTLNLNPEQAGVLARQRYTHGLSLTEMITPRIATGPLDAVKQGTIETRDFILQFYLTLRRMVTRDISAENLMGPIGIFQSGTFFAKKGGDWLLWFLAMISANLAVVNFLPIPIVDGGLFTFLLIEKIKGRPVSPRTQAIAQYVGLALLLGVFLFVTYQDLMNFQFRMR